MSRAALRAASPTLRTRRAASTLASRSGRTSAASGSGKLVRWRLMGALGNAAGTRF